MFTFLLIVQTLVAAALVAVILMQRSEGGGLGVGGSSAGLMTARGAADFLTRATAILGGLFIFLSIAARRDRRRQPRIDRRSTRRWPRNSRSRRGPGSGASRRRRHRPLRPATRPRRRSRWLSRPNRFFQLI